MLSAWVHRFAKRIRGYEKAAIIVAGDLGVSLSQAGAVIVITAAQKKQLRTHFPEFPRYAFLASLLYASSVFPTH